MKPEFQFTQSNLQDFIDCPRRFELRYLLQLKWPAVQTEPELEQENHMRQGQNFHRLVHQHILAQPVDQLFTQINDPDLQIWWQNYLQSDLLTRLPPFRFPEFSLAAPFEGTRILAKYDLLAIEVGSNAFIVDWKTSRRRPPRRIIQQRVQTRLYPFLLVNAGAHLNSGQPISPDQIEMMYWFTEEPEKPEHFTYDLSLYHQDHEFLAGLINEINRTLPGNFLMTPDEKLCRFCNYRSLCNRGIKPGSQADWDDEQEPASDQPLTIDFDQVAEIEF
jgi:CRISPR/Cas system-associated exonuclease Cas4 (RecB family)